jgi:anthranilate phosphoribosyltransferase
MHRVLAKVVAGEDLSEAEAVEAMERIMTGRASDAQIAGLLVALRIKGVTVQELSGAAKVMRRSCLPVPARGCARPLLDTCGTGGDGAGSFNVSTVAALVAAGAGATVAKHGNRGVSSACGSADLMEALGVDLGLAPSQVGRCLAEAGIGFLFAPELHPAMRHVIAPRRELKMRTIFNLLGPLTNPAGAEAQLLGVYSPELVEPLARVLREMGLASAMVVHGAGGLDEISLCGPTRAAVLRGGAIRLMTIEPAQVGLATCGLAAVKGGPPAESARLVLALLRGRPGPRRDLAVLNAGAALFTAGLAGDLREGVALAARSLDSGAALAKLELLARTSRRLAREKAA